ncbi:MAG: class I SAM-dependent methyltransferase [Pseudomonadales bacterium]
MEFSSKYHEDAFPERYADKHGETALRRLNDRREQALLARCLRLCNPTDTLADIGCGPGRFWPTLSTTGASDLFALDVSHAMLRYARQRHGPLGDRFGVAAGSVLTLPFVDGAFDTTVCLRLLHHFGDPAQRRAALAELARVSRRHVVVSLWTDGNYKAWRRSRLERRRGRRAYENRHVVPRRTLEADFGAAGLTVVRHFDLVPAYSQWRYYVLRKAEAR